MSGWAEFRTSVASRLASLFSSRRQGLVGHLAHLSLSSSLLLQMAASTNVTIISLSCLIAAGFPAVFVQLSYLSWKYWHYKYWQYKYQSCILHQILTEWLFTNKNVFRLSVEDMFSQVFTMIHIKSFVQKDWDQFWPSSCDTLINLFLLDNRKSNWARGPNCPPPKIDSQCSTFISLQCNAIAGVGDK